MGVNLRRIKAYRVYNELDQQSMSEMLGISRTSYYLKETGGREFTSTEIAKMADVFKVDVGDLFSKETKLG